MLLFEFCKFDRFFSRFEGLLLVRQAWIQAGLDTGRLQGLCWFVSLKQVCCVSLEASGFESFDAGYKLCRLVEGF